METTICPGFDEKFLRQDLLDTGFMTTVNKWFARPCNALVKLLVW